MKRKNALLAGLLILVMVFALNAPAFAQGSSGGGPPMLEAATFFLQLEVVLATTWEPAFEILEELLEMLL